MDCRHLLRLVRKGMTEHDGWAPVSAVVWPLVAALPDDLVEREPGDEGAGRVRLTPEGDTVMAWLL